MRTVALCGVFSALLAAACLDQSVTKTDKNGSGGSSAAAAGDSTLGQAGSTLNGHGGSSAQAGSSAEGGTTASGGAATGGATASGGASAGTDGSGGSAIVIDKTKRDIVSVSGQVFGNTNGFGIQGNWASFHADTATLMTDFTGSKVCTTASYPKVPDASQWPNYWGGGISLVLNSPTVGGASLPYDAPAHQFAGIELTIVGPQIPHEIRLKYKQVGTNDSYCKAFFNVKTGDHLRFLVSEATKDCWNAGGANVDPTNIEHFELHVWPELAGDINMDLCLTDMSVIPVGEEGTGGSGGAAGTAGSGGANAGTGGAGGASAGAGGSGGASAGAGSSAGTGGAGAG